MKIFSASDIRAWDAYTIRHEPIVSVDLMERAAAACFLWIRERYHIDRVFKIFCGTGNNGGDGLAIARLLAAEGYHVHVYIAGSIQNCSPDFKANFEKINVAGISVTVLEDTTSFPSVSAEEMVVDALFGTGLNRPPEGIFASLIHYLNASGANIISIDIASGLFADKSLFEEPASSTAEQPVVIRPRYTLTFQSLKLAFLLPENEPFTGEVVVLPIGLSKAFEETVDTPYSLIDSNLVKKIYKPRKAFSHKGDYGHACLLAGSYGMMGAAVLSSGACLRSGAGKLTCHTCAQGYAILQSGVPEAMCRVSGESFLSADIAGLEGFDAIGIGPGIGNHPEHALLLKNLFSRFARPVVMDADALNTMSREKELLTSVPEGSILTPHPKEFERLFGPAASGFERIQQALSIAAARRLYIVLKGHFTLIATPEGKGFFNSTGNAGMATAGSGDVLTGILTGLLAQGYSPYEACILGVYLHGLAGDLAAGEISQEALIAGDIIRYMGKAFTTIAAL